MPIPRGHGFTLVAAWAAWSSPVSTTWAPLSAEKLAFGAISAALAVKARKLWGTSIAIPALRSSRSERRLHRRVQRCRAARIPRARLRAADDRARDGGRVRERHHRRDPPHDDGFPLYRSMGFATAETWDLSDLNRRRGQCRRSRIAATTRRSQEGSAEGAGRPPRGPAHLTTASGCPRTAEPFAGRGAWSAVI
jgi:hypothetical protein